MKQASDDNKRTGAAGAIFILLMDTESRLTNATGVGFPKVMPGDAPSLGSSWEEWLTGMLNGGIVM